MQGRRKDKKFRFLEVREASSLHLKKGQSNALSFYRSQNVLCRSKFFEPAQKFDCIQCLLKNFCAGTKTNFTVCKSSFCLFDKFLVQHKNFGPAQNILGPVRTRYKALYYSTEASYYTICFLTSNLKSLLFCRFTLDCIVPISLSDVLSIKLASDTTIFELVPSKSICVAWALQEIKNVPKR